MELENVAGAKARKVLFMEHAGNVANIQTSKTRTQMKATLQTDVHFIESMRVYFEKTHCVLPRYDNRLYCDFDEKMWNIVDQTRQCCSCGQMLMSMNSDVKLMSCGVCKITHYCARDCQKRDWKFRHKLVCSATPFVKNLDASHLCIRILSIMSLSTTSEGASSSCVMMEKPDILNSLFSFEKKDAVSLGDDAFAAYLRINDADNPVCNHFRQKQESNRILFPIWNTCTDNLAFVPVSFDFMMGGGAAGGSCSVMDENIRKNSKIYSVGVKCVDDGKRIVLPVCTFVKVCAIDWQ